MAGYEKSAHLYDLFDSKENVAFFLSYASMGGKILDVGAGTGRIAIPLAEQGAHVVCVEPSAAMRRVFERKLARRPALRDRIELVPADAARFSLARTLPVAYMSGVFDHFLDREERQAALRNTIEHVDPGGLLVFDVFLGLMGATPLSSAGHVRDGDSEHRRFVGREVLSEDRVKVRLIYETRRDGKVVGLLEEESLVGITSREEIHLLLTDVGAVVANEFSDYEGAPYREGDDLSIIEAVRRRSFRDAGERTDELTRAHVLQVQRTPKVHRTGG